MEFFKACVLLVASVFAQNALAENVKVTPFYGYQFGGHINTYQGELQIEDGENIGISIEVPYGYGTTLQFLYITQDTTLTLKNNFLGSITELFDMSVDYYHIGGTKVIDKGNVTSFFSGSLGVTMFNPDDPGYSDESLFSFSVGLGVVKNFTKNLALRVQGRLLLPIQTAGGSIFCSNSGCAVGISGGTSIVQADVTGGLQFKF